MEDNAKVILHLSLIPGIGPATIMQLLAVCMRGTIFGDSFETLYTFSVNDMKNYGKLSEEVSQRIIRGLACHKLVDQELEFIQRYGINCLTLFDKDYPEAVKNMYAPPLVLYIMGTGDFHCDKQLAIVGSRAGDSYGEAVLSSYIPQFVQAGWTIVSGGARGIDTFAHRLALEAGGITGAVLGSGLLSPYPASNKRLFREIRDSGGYLMSPFPLTMSPLEWTFPARNRVIAGLARGCLVVQAAKKSGALITARFALDQGKEVFAVPGRVDHLLSAGCHNLIAEGASIASSAEAVLGGLGCDGAELQSQGGLKKVNSGDQESQLSIVTHDSRDPRGQLYNLCNKPISLDELVEKSGLSSSVVHDTLLALMLEGKVSQSMIGLWQWV
jgi:DNA processing protein